MQVNLSWTNRNVGEEGTRIYKSSAFISNAALGTALVTLPPGASSYADTAVVRDQMYHYRIEIFKGTDVVLSQDIAAQAIAYTGPGPQELIAGDFERGYFGLVEAYNFIGYEALATAVAAPNTGSNYAQALPKWLKFAHKGKILFVAMQPVRMNVTWLSLYNLGLVYGVDGTGTPGITGLAGVNQKKIVSIEGNNFLVRLLKGRPPAMTTFPAVSGGQESDYAWDVTSEMVGSEWDDLMVGVVSVKPASFRGDSLGLLDYKLLAPDNRAYGSTLCQEVSAAGLCSNRGGHCDSSLNLTASIPYVSAGFLLTHAHNVQGPAALFTLGNANTNYYASWRPVLEWVPAA